jgi:hypothetical protein
MPRSKKLKKCYTTDYSLWNIVYVENLIKKANSIKNELPKIKWNSIENGNNEPFYKKGRFSYYCLLNAINNLFKLSNESKITPQMLDFCRIMQEIQILKGVVKSFNIHCKISKECQNCHDEKIRGNWSVDAVMHLGVYILEPKVQLVNIKKKYNVNDNNSICDIILLHDNEKYILEVYTEMEGKRKAYYVLHDTADEEVENIGQLHAISVGNGFIYDDSLQKAEEFNKNNFNNVMSKYYGIHTCYLVELCKQSDK